MKDFGKLRDVATAKHSHLYLGDVLPVLVSTKMKNRKKRHSEYCLILALSSVLP